MFRSHLLRRSRLGLSHSVVVRAVLLTSATTTAGRHSESQRQRGSRLASQTAEGGFPRPEPPTATRRSVYTISESDLSDLMSSSLGIDYSLWYDIGLELGIEDSKLNTIKANHAGKPFQSSDCMCDVYVHWIRTERNPTYENLAKVLSAVGMREIALTLCAKYGIPTAVLPIPKCISKYANFLKENYNEVPIFPSSIQDWPTHNIGKKLQYIHLALIEPGAPLSQKELAEFFCHNSLLGKVDRIVAKKMEIEVDDMLKPLPTMPNSQKGLRILVNGAPGVGKTTFSRKICKDWGQGCVQALEQYELVVLLELRERRLAKATQIDDLFPHIDPVLHERVVKQIRKTEGEKILLIIDGYDELGLRKQSLYKKIIEGKILQKCTVLITSRQYASEDLIQHVHRHVEVLGFTEEDIEKSISASIPDKTKAAQLCELLQQRQDLTSLCYIPLVCAIVTHVYMEEGYVLLNTLTELYSKLVINLAKRNAKL